MNNYSFLVVDDEEVVRKTLKLDLKRRGYEVAVAENGEVAIEMMRNVNYDLIITDLMMDKCDGICVLKEAIKLNNLSMVMILTGYATIKTAIDALRLGACDYMLKPYEKDEMLARIINCLKKVELQKKVKLYEDILPVCCKCKKIRDDTGKMHGEGEWLEMERYLMENSNMEITHGFCDRCYEEQTKDLHEFKRINREGDNYGGDSI